MPRKIINILLLAFVTLLAACHKEKEVNIPDGILDKPQFAKLLADLALAESAANMNIKNVAVYRIDSTYAFNPLKENNVSQAQYDSTIAFYSAHTELYKEVYEEALNLLNELQTRRDSLKRVK